MPRHRTMQDQLATLKRKYHHVSPLRFFYNKPAELRKRYKEIIVWFLIHDTDSDRNSIFSPRFRVATAMPLADWSRRFENPVGSLVPLLNILNQNILPAINAKGGRDWKFKALIGWTGHNEPKKLKGSRVSESDKPAKKRNRAKRD
mgnify:CR=1 FL=1